MEKSEKIELKDKKVRVIITFQNLVKNRDFHNIEIFGKNREKLDLFSKVEDVFQFQTI
jgi:hypothetical protein